MKIVPGCTGPGERDVDGKAAAARGGDDNEDDEGDVKIWKLPCIFFVKNDAALLPLKTSDGQTTLSCPARCFFPSKSIVAIPTSYKASRKQHNIAKSCQNLI
jgi:hypothetical protein